METVELNHIESETSEVGETDEVEVVSEVDDVDEPNEDNVLQPDAFLLATLSADPFGVGKDCHL